MLSKEKMITLEDCIGLCGLTEEEVLAIAEHEHLPEIAATALAEYLPSPAERPPSGAGWLHEIKHDGMRVLARRDGADVRLITRQGNDFTSRFPFIVAAVAALPRRSFLIDGEAIATNGDGLAVFDLIRRQRQGENAVMVAFDLIELDGEGRCVSLRPVLTSRYYDGARALPCPDTPVGDRGLDLRTLASRGMTARRFPLHWSVAGLRSNA
jgi:ATP dependent DNA ligase domain